MHARGMATRAPMRVVCCRVPARFSRVDVAMVCRRISGQDILVRGAVRSLSMRHPSPSLVTVADSRRTAVAAPAVLARCAWLRWAAWCLCIDDTFSTATCCLFVHSWPLEVSCERLWDCLDLPLHWLSTAVFVGHQDSLVRRPARVPRTYRDARDVVRWA